MDNTGGLFSPLPERQKRPERWVQIDHKCGHKGAKKTWRTGLEFEVWKLKWANELCTECFKQEQENRDMSYALATAESMRLPGLIGSEKQKRWALDIRHSRISEFFKLRMKAMEDGTIDVHLMREIFNRMLEKRECRYWIDRRFVRLQEMIREEASEEEMVFLVMF